MYCSNKLCLYKILFDIVNGIHRVGLICDSVLGKFRMHVATDDVKLHEGFVIFSRQKMTRTVR